MNDPDYGVAHANIRFSEESLTGRSANLRKCYRSGIIQRLGIQLKKDEPVPRIFNVAQHHFTRKQLRWMRLEKKKWVTPLTASQNQIVNRCPDDHRFTVMDKGTRLFFALPDNVESDIKADIVQFNSPRAERCQAQDHRNQKRQRENEERDFQEMGFRGFIELREDFDDTENSLQNDLSDKDRIIQEKDNLIKELRNKLKVNETRNRMTRMRKNSDDISERSAPDLNLQQNIDHIIFDTIGGLSRLTIMSSEWHQKNRNAANMLFGFPTWLETKIYIKCLFPDVNTTERIYIKVENGQLMCVDKLSEFEHCLVAKMFFQCLPKRTSLGAVWNLSNSQIKRILSKWAPRWGMAGEYLSILPMPPEYFEKETPDEYFEEGLEKVCHLMDGKDFLVYVRRKNDPVRRRTLSPKVHACAGRCMTWTTPTGLTFEHTKLFGGRATEVSLVKLWGSEGVSKADIKEWKGKFLQKETNKEQRLQTSVDDVDFSNLTNLDNEEEDHVIEVVEDDGDESNPEDNGREEPEMNHNASYSSILRNLRKKQNEQRKDRIDREGQNQQDTYRKSIFQNIKDMELEAERALKSSPQHTPEQTIYQLETLERLHREYEGKNLQKCLLSYYLHETKDFRLSILKWLGSKLVAEDY